MKPWDEERLMQWLMMAVSAKPADIRRHFLDISDKTFFTLEAISGNYRPWSKYGKGINAYPVADQDIVLSKIDKLENESQDIIEVPRDRELIDALENNLEIVKMDPKHYYMLRERIYDAKGDIVRSWIRSLNMPVDEFRLVYPWND